MNNIKVAACALNQIPLDWEGNFDRICQAIDLAYAQKVSLLCLPELCITGYSLEDLFFAREVHKKSLEYLQKIVNYLYNKVYGYINSCASEHYNPMAVSVGLPYFLDGALYNVAAMITAEGIQGFVPKQNLANDGVHYESRWFKPGIPNATWKTDDDHNFGDIIFDFKGIRVGFEICEDLWVANRPAAALAQRAVDIILNPSASHFAFGKHKIRENMIVDSSRAFKCTYIYSNLLGNEAGRVIFEGDAFIASGGKLIASGPRMSFKDIILTTAIIDTDLTKTQQAMNGSFHPSDDGFLMITCSRALQNTYKTENDNQLLAENLNKYDEFIFAESLGLFDYMRKSHSTSFTLSLSGGADSAVCACLIKFMQDRGIAQLGKEKFIKKSGLKTNAENDINENLMSKLLTCIYQATENSGHVTFNAAKIIAKGVGATFIDWNVNSIMKDYIELVELNIGRKLNWETDDIALQNIQARIRVPGLWMIANINQSILLCTSNRSETAVGYCTTDGDLSGSLSPISGVSKEFLLDFLDEMYSLSIKNNNDIIDHIFSNNYNNYPNWLVCLKEVIDQKPTAELRPTEQLDTQDLMPYNILDRIEQLAILEKKFPHEVLDSLYEEYNIQYDLKILKNWINKFFKLWQRNQWKRERMPVGFILDSESLCPKTWCRFPVLSGDFEKI